MTGFDPFGGDAVNPSWLAAQALDGQVIEGHRVASAMLPTVFGESVHVLRERIAREQPALVLLVGQAGGRAAISLERIAINVDDARIPDNAGAQPIDAPVVPGGPAAYFSTLPIKAMLLALRAAGIPAEVSQTAGTFVCNHVFYALMHALAGPRHAGVRGGLVHVPWLPRQGAPSLPLEDIVRGLRIGIACGLARAGDDVAVSAGALS